MLLGGLAFEGDEQAKVKGGQDGAVRVWDCATRLQHAALEGAHGGLPCHAVCFAPDPVDA